MWNVKYQHLRSHDWVVAELDVDAACALIETRLGDLHWRLLVLDSLAQKFNVLLHVEDLSHRLKEGKGRLRKSQACFIVIMRATSRQRSFYF